MPYLKLSVYFWVEDMIKISSHDDRRILFLSWRYIILISCRCSSNLFGVVYVDDVVFSLVVYPDDSITWKCDWV